MNEFQTKEYNKILEQATELKGTTFANELSENCAWENLLVKLFTLAVEICPKVTMLFLIKFSDADKTLQKVFEDLSMILKAYVRPPAENKKPKRAQQSKRLLKGPPGVAEAFIDYISFEAAEFPKGFAYPKKEGTKK